MIGRGYKTYNTRESKKREHGGMTEAKEAGKAQEVEEEDVPILLNAHANILLLSTDQQSANTQL